jgi:hypothetical protein
MFLTKKEREEVEVTIKEENFSIKLDRLIDLLDGDKMLRNREYEKINNMFSKFPEPKFTNGDTENIIRDLRFIKKMLEIDYASYEMLWNRYETTFHILENTFKDGEKLEGEISKEIKEKTLNLLEIIKKDFYIIKEKKEELLRIEKEVTGQSLTKRLEDEIEFIKRHSIH